MNEPIMIDVDQSEQRQAEMAHMARAQNRQGWWGAMATTILDGGYEAPYARLTYDQRAAMLDALFGDGSKIWTAPIEAGGHVATVEALSEAWSGFMTARGIDRPDRIIAVVLADQGLCGASATPPDLIPIAQEMVRRAKAEGVRLS